MQNSLVNGDSKRTFNKYAKQTAYKAGIFHPVFAGAASRLLL